MAQAITGTTRERMTGAHALVAALEKQGVKYLFGVPGHGAYPIYDALNDVSGVTPVVGRNEQGSLFCADGYSRVTEDVAVATSVPLAGVTNASTGLWEINGHGSRVLYLLEHNPVHEELLRPLVRHYRKVFRVGDVAPAAHELIHLLRTRRPGLAVLEVPNGVLHSVGVADPGDGHREALASAPDSAAIDHAASVLSGADRPVICADGYGWTSRAGRALTSLAERLQAPVLTANMSKGAIGENHPLSLGINWNTGGHAERLLGEADVILGIGPRTGMVTGQRSAETLAHQLIHLDWDGAEQGPAMPTRIQLNGYLPAMLEALAEQVTPRRHIGWPVEVLDRVRGASRARASEQIPWALPFYQSLREALPPDGLLFTDSLAGLWAFRLFPAYAPNTVHFPWFTGTLGHGIPAAVGAATAHPERTVAVLAGDGAFLYNSQELATMKYYRRKMIVIVANDNCYGAILFNTAERFGRSIAFELANPDFVKLGDAYGMRATRLESPEQIGTAVREAIAADQATLIEVPLQLRPPKL